KRTLELLVVNKARALEELENDWTCTMALAETLQMKFAVPFRVGHNFASGIVTVARRDGWLPKNFPFEEARRIYREVTEKLLGEASELPLSEPDFRQTLHPEYVVRTRVGVGSPAPESTAKGLEASLARLEADERWVKERREKLAAAEANLDSLFNTYL
ncbi:MAG TPA: argininosuccinate lyase, partial [Sutterella sp.]|nr:argininosuccinate lyase [Sutterella sp.]